MAIKNRYAINILMTPELYAALQKHIYDSNESASSFVRDLIIKELNLNIPEESPLRKRRTLTKKETDLSLLGPHLHTTVEYTEDDGVVIVKRRYDKGELETMMTPEFSGLYRQTITKYKVL